MKKDNWFNSKGYYYLSSTPLEYIYIFGVGYKIKEYESIVKLNETMIEPSNDELEEHTQFLNNIKLCLQNLKNLPKKN